MKGFIDEAIAEAGRRGVVGKAVTPFLLSFLFESTGGRSLATNIALVKNNAALAARLAASVMRPAG
jgi:pseudouridine-5'-phosphate glycosidase